MVRLNPEKGITIFWDETQPENKSVSGKEIKRLENNPKVQGSIRNAGLLIVNEKEVETLVKESGYTFESAETVEKKAPEAKEPKK